MRTKISWADGVVAVLCATLALLLLCGTLGRDAGEVLVISDLHTGEELQIPLDRDDVVVRRGGAYTLTIEIVGGRARVVSCDCPDQVCVHSGWIDRDGDTVVCAPAGISLCIRRTDGGEGGKPDAVAG